MRHIFTAVLIIISNILFAQSSTVVISQIYGGGSNTGATYNADFVELHNKSTVPQSIDGMSIQYHSATGTGKWAGVILLPNATIPAGGYYLIQTNAAGAVGASFPATPEFTASVSVNMSATNGRVALVNGTDTLIDCPNDASIIDLVGYGTSVCFEGAVLGALSNTTAAIRNTFGCDDTNNNAADLIVGTPDPRNSSTSVFICGVTPIPPILNATTLSSFGAICITSGGTEGSFTISGTNLSTVDITIDALSGFSYALASGGPYSSTLTITQPGGNFASQTIYVKFNPTQVQSYSGSIPVSGGGAASINVAASGSGVNASELTTLTANSIATNSANLRGTLVQGCLATTQYGFEYSTTNGFAPGTGTIVNSTNLSAGSFSFGLTGLTASTTYYYVSFVTNSGGTIYGTAQSFTTSAQSAGGSGVVISQVYGGGGSASGTYNADYVELHNNGTTSQDISGCKIMYASAAGTFGSATGNVFTFPAGVVVPAGGYVLVATTPGIGLANLPVTADYTFTLTLSGTNGKVLFGTSALVSATTLAAQPAGSVLDAVGYGNANEFEGTATAALSTTTAALRNNNGCTDANNNSADFTIGAPSPRNSASAVFLCGGAVTPSLSAGTLNAFGSVCLNTNSSSNSFSLNGTNLTAGDITVGPLTGYSFSLSATGTFTSTLTISQTGGTLAATTIFVQLTPTVAQSYDGNISISGGGATTVSVSASGTGAASVTPTFTQVADICSGETFTLPTTSINSINGTWSPAINNTTTTTYTFTPNPDQCASTATMTVNVTQSTVPAFTQVATVCSGETFTLPSTSNNSITGTWSPVINNTATTTYTFTPDAGQCATIVTMTVTVTQQTVPEFTQVSAICTGGAFTLPTTSNNSITGTWSPVINNTATTTYTFTPNSGQCAQVATMTVTVNNAGVTPLFTQVADICSGGTFTLPTTSNNSITGTWIPAIDNTTTTTYTFTPDAGQCAVSATMTVNVITSGTASASTGSSSAITTTGATLDGTITLTCATATAYGIEYSTTSGFTPGSGTVVNGTNLSANAFSVSLSGLTASTTYYYIAFVTTSSGTQYGTEQLFTTNSSIPSGTGVVISQVYGGGGNPTGTFNADYVELHNNGTTAQDISGNKIMYGSATGNLGSTTTNIFTFPAGVSIPAGGYVLVAQAANTGLANLPVTPDYTFTANMSTANGKVVYGTAALTANATLASQPVGSVLDFVGYGTAGESENTPAPALTVTTAVIRNNNGCDDTNNNSTDFTTGTPLPRNSTSPVFVCGGVASPALSVTNLTAFGSVCINTTSSSNSFSVSGTNLTAGDISVGPLAGYGFSLTAIGTYTSTLTIPQTGGALPATTVFVQFTPTAVQTYDGNIAVSGGGATTINVAASGSGVTSVTPTFTQVADVCSGGTFTLPTTSNNSISGTWSPAINSTATTTYTFTPNAGQCADPTTMTVTVITNGTASATTGVSSAISSAGATLAGSVSLTCVNATAYGIEYSTTSGFTPGSGTVVNGTNLSANAYTVSLSGLTASTTYYYIAFVTTASGTQYGTQSSFTTSGSTTTGPAIVISQVYGGGSNTGATFNADYVELHNRSNTTQSLSGLSVQYASATGTTTWSGVISLPTADIPAGGYYLIQTTTAGTVGANLPAADFTATTAVNLSGTNGKVALVNGATALVGCPTAGQYIDMVGYGTANCSETTAMPALSSILAAFRNNNGCDDTDNNSADFSTATPAPRNSASPVVICGSTPSGAVLNASNLPNFGSVIIGTTFVQSFNITGSNLTGAPGVISISSSNGLFLVSTDNINWSASVTVPFTAAALASTTIYVQFAPVAIGSFTSIISINGGGANALSLTASGTGMNIPVNPILNVTSSTLAFGDVCSFNTTGPLSFTITGTNLTADAVVVGLLNGFAYSLSQTGPFTSTLNISHASGSFSQVVYVQFTPNAEAVFDGSIGITGGGASAVFVTVTGTGTKSTPDVVTGDSTLITTRSAVLSGSITAIGCTDVTEYGVEVSGVAGFINGSGVRYQSSDLTSGLFHANVSGLVQNTPYYYKAYAKNNGGYAYGTEKLFITSPIKAGLQLYSVPFIRGQYVHYSLSGIKPGHYTIKMFDAKGQLAFKEQVISQVNIIDNQFLLPLTLSTGVYTFEVANPTFRIVKTVIVY